MSLSAGGRLGAYEIVAALGKGGMGEVYRAHDPALGRDVAVKRLPEDFVTSPERVARFQREAQLLAALNHPNIATIYGFEVSNDAPFLVLELVEGESLAQRVARGAVPVAEALALARQLADALASAHEKNIIHRDLKPANIMVTPDGVVKVLDFGLAKALTPPQSAATEGADSPTITDPAVTRRHVGQGEERTQTGVILGTAAYMSPEQAKGRDADKRSDVWAFGCVLYEMLTGLRAFQGDDLGDTLANVLKIEPDWSRLPGDVPPLVETLLRRCLEKDRRDRIGDVAAVQFTLTLDPMPTKSLGPSGLAPPPLGPRWRRLVTPGITLVTGAAASAIISFLLFEPQTPQPVTRLAMSTAGGAAVASDGNDRSLAVAPDGARIAYTSASTSIYTGSNTRLFVRALDQLEPLLLAGPGSVREPFFSPDGAWVGFFEPNTRMHKVSAGGGPPIPIAALDGYSRGATWGLDGTIIFATGNGTTGLQQVSANGGEPTILTRPNSEHGERDHFWPHLLPGGQAVLFTITRAGPIDNAQIAVFNLRDRSQKVVLTGGSDARYVAGGYLVYGNAGTLRAVPFDLDRLEVRGTPVPVLQQVLTTLTDGAANFAVTANGALTYLSGSATNAARTLVWVDRQGREEPVGVPARAYTYARLSPDGTRLVLDVRDDQSDVWIWDLKRQTMTRLTLDQGLNRAPIWTPDGRRVAFSAERDDEERVYWQAADGTDAAEPLMNDPVARLPSSFSPDGKRLLFHQPGVTPYDVGVFTLDGSHPAELLLRGAYNEQNAEVSPDGRWLAYQSNESGRDEIYVRPFPEVDRGKWQVSAGGGTRPLWARDGRELFYFVETLGVLRVPIQPGTTFVAGAADVVVRGAAFSAPNSGRMYDVSPDGQRFLMVKEVPPTEESSVPVQIIVVQNWQEELKRLVPAGN